jgi:hypothetical protein
MWAGNNDFAYWLPQITGCGTSCTALLNCAAIDTAMSQLPGYGGSGPPYSLPFAEAYLQARFQNLGGLDSASFRSIFSCCVTPNLDYTTDTLSYCDQVEYLRFLVQYNLPNHNCLPNWLYTYMISQLRPLVPAVTDSTNEQLCADLTTCKITCLPTCDTVIVSLCDSIASVGYVYHNLLAGEGLSVDTQLLNNVYSVLFQTVQPYTTTMNQINNCSITQSVLTHISYSAQNVQYSDSAGHNYVEFDVFVVDSPAGLLYSQSNLYIDYNSLFGTNLVSSGTVTASKGTVISNPDYTMTLSDSLPQLLKIKITHSDSVTSLPTIATNQQLCHLRVNLSSLNLTAIGVAWDTIAMAGQSEYKQTPNGLEYPYDLVEVSGLVGAPLYVVDSITYQLAFDTVFYNYSGSSVYAETIVFDIQASSPNGDNLFDADPVISYNTNAFRSNVCANGYLTCTSTASGDYDFLLPGDFSPSAFQIHLDADMDNFDLDLVNGNFDSIIGVGGYPVTLATCSLNVLNCCVGIDLSVNRNSTGFYATADTSGDVIPSQYGVASGAGIDTSGICALSALPLITGFYPPSITAGTFDTLTINGVGFGCAAGLVVFTNAQQTISTTMSCQPPDIVSWGDDQIRVLVPSCQYGYNDGLIAATGPFYVNAGGGPSNNSPTSLGIAYAAITARDTGLVAARIGLWGDTVKPIPPSVHYNEYTFTPDITITDHTSALNAITHALNDWVCETGVRFIMGTPVDSNLTHAVDGINSIYFGTIPGNTTAYAQTYATIVPTLCINAAGEKVNYIIDEDYVFSGTYLDQNNLTPWYLHDTSVLPSDPLPGDSGWISLLGVARHEFGHGMGLWHVLNPNDLMYVYANPPNTCSPLHYDDVYGGLYELLTVGSTQHSSGCFTPNPQSYGLGGPSCSDNIAGIASAAGDKYSITAYPNPFDQTITITAQLAAASEIKIELVNVLGQVIASDDFGKVSGGQFQRTISTDGLSAGMYLVSISINGTNTVLKLVKN